MKIEDAKELLSQIEKISPNLEVRVVVDSLPELEDQIERLSAKPIYQMSVWSDNEIVFAEKRLKKE